MTSFVDIWTDKDQSDQELFLDALEQQNLAKALLAIEGVELEREEQVYKQLEHWADQVKKIMDRGAVTHPVDALRLLFVDVLEMRGDSEDYFHPQNSHLSQVIQRKRGLPILLSTVWMIVGELAGIEVKGVGMPGHFIIQVTGETSHYVDPFDGGETLSVTDCKAIVSKLYRKVMPWRDQFLATLDMKGVLERVLRNLVSIYTQREELEPLYRTLRFFSSLCPDLPELLLNQGQVAELAGETVLALEAYQSFLDRFPDASEAESVADKAEELGMRTQLLY